MRRERPVGLTIFSAAALAFGLAAGAQAQTDQEEDIYAPEFPTTEFADGATSASVTVGNVTAGVSVVKGAGDDSDVPVLQVTVAGNRVIDVPGVSSGFDIPAAEASIAEMDSSNKSPEIYFSSYSGGAHCCSSVIIVADVAGKWTAVPLGEFDGDGNYLGDLDRDGIAEVVTVDNRFLYQFDCYACSAAPLIVLTVKGGKAVDVTADPKFAAAHRDWLKDMEENSDEETRWTSPGYLAGWVAAKARVGEGADAMKQLRAHWDDATDVGEEVCMTGGEPESCKKADIKVLKFPERLELFLKSAGFPL